MNCDTNIKPVNQAGIRFGDRDIDLATALPTLAYVRRQKISVVVKSLLREALRNVTDLPDNVKGLVA